MPRRPHLHALAERHGILPSYLDQEGQRRDTSDEAYIALLAAMGVDATTERAAERQRTEDERDAASRLIEPTQVLSRKAVQVTLNLDALPGTGSLPVEWDFELHCEDGRTENGSGRGSIVKLPRSLPLGYHRLVVRAARGGTVPVSGEQFLIITPPRCVLPYDRIGSQRVFGLLANLYTLRSAHNWGVGDCGDLRALVRWSGEIGGAFVGINPLHALVNSGACISPYNPVTRLFRNVIYLDVEALPELRDSAAARRRLRSPSVQDELSALRATNVVDYERVMRLKRSLLEPLYRNFVRQHRDRDTSRGRAFRRYCQREGSALLDFATFEALREHWDARGRGCDWHRWPAAFRDGRSRQVERFRQEHRDEIELHRYLQFALDAQLAKLDAAAQAQRVPLGVYQDLAIGSAGDGADTWAFPDLFVAGASVGAPPDNYNAAGQNWSFPPLSPRQLRLSGYDYFARLVRAGMRHAGALRIDHVMGLVRQYWIPAGAPAHAGAYVRAASEDLFGILALESHRSGAVVVGEDLGTVPPELPALLDRWGVLSTRVFYFERDRRGAYRPARRYPRRALVSANTHDLPPIAGFVDASDLTQRAALGLFPNDRELERARLERGRDTKAMRRRLGLSKTSSAPTALRNAIHGFLATTPSALLGIALDDLAGEREGVNVPGVGVEQHPNWSRRMERTLASLRGSTDIDRALRSVRMRRWKKARRAR